MAGRRPNGGETRQFTVTVTARMFELLSMLAEDSFYGATPSEIASYFVRERVGRMFSEKEITDLNAKVDAYMARKAQAQAKDDPS